MQLSLSTLRTTTLRPGLTFGAHPAVGIFLVVATALAVLPQVVLLLRTRSSEGVSVLTPALALSFGYLNLCSTTLVKWPALLSIGHNALQLLDFMQQAASALGLAVILLLVVMYKPNHGRAKRLGAAALLAVLVAIGVALCLLSAHAPCSELTMSIASAASVASGVMVVIAFCHSFMRRGARAAAARSRTSTMRYKASAACSSSVFSSLASATRGRSGRRRSSVESFKALSSSWASPASAAARAAAARWCG